MHHAGEVSGAQVAAAAHRIHGEGGATAPAARECAARTPVEPWPSGVATFDWTPSSRRGRARNRRSTRPCASCGARRARACPAASSGWKLHCVTGLVRSSTAAAMVGDRIAIGCRDRLTRRSRRSAGAQAPQRRADEIATRCLEGVGVVGEVAGRRLVDGLRAPVDVRGLGEPDRRDGASVVRAAVHEQREAVVRDARVRVHAARIGGRAVVLDVGDLARIGEAVRVPHVPERVPAGRRARVECGCILARRASDRSSRAATLLFGRSVTLTVSPAGSRPAIRFR